MLKSIKARLTFAILLTTGLLDLQLYIHRFHQPTEMLGEYLHRHLEKHPCGQSTITATGKCTNSVATRSPPPRTESH
jgi:hypothetical protein